MLLTRRCIRVAASTAGLPLGLPPPLPLLPPRVWCSGGHPECQQRPRNPFFDPGFEDSIWGPRPRCVIGGKNQVTMASGIGIGPELMAIVQRVFLVANAPVTFEVVEMGEEAEDEDLDNLIYSVERNGAAIKGHFGMELRPEELMTRSFRMKRALDLCINAVAVKSYAALAAKTRLQSSVDVVIVSPNSEGASALLEHNNGIGVENLRVTTEYNTRRVAEFAFNYAVQHNRRGVKLVYNKGIMNWAEGTIIAAVSDVAARYPQIQFLKQSMKAFIFKLKHFEAYNGEVIVAMPLYAGIIKNIVFSLMQGTGLYCAQNLGPRYAVFEAAARNKGTKMVGKDVVNPLAVLDAGVKLLRYLGHEECAERIQRAVEVTVEEDKVHTRDMLGEASTSAMVDNIERRIREMMPPGYRGESPVVQPPPPQQPPPDDQ